MSRNYFGDEPHCRAALGLHERRVGERIGLKPAPMAVLVAVAGQMAGALGGNVPRTFPYSSRANHSSNHLIV
jgi:hypothetical protein